MLPKEVVNLPFDYGIFYNGQLIYNAQRQRIVDHPFLFNQQCELLQYATDHKLSLLLQTDKKMVGNIGMKAAQSELLLPMVHYLKDHVPDKTVQQFHQLKKVAPRINYLKKYRKLNPVYQAVVLQPQSEDAQLKKALPTFNITRSNPFTVEIVNYQSSKITGLKKVTSLCGVSLDEILFFGDHYNDMEVMKNVRHGVAMANAIRELREVASFVTTSNENDGIRNALKYFHLI